MRRGLSAAAAVAVPLLLILAGGPAIAGPPAAVKKSALIVGVSRHTGGRPAAPVGGAGDAAAMETALRNAGWPADSIRVLTDSAATAANIRAGISWLADRSNGDSFTVFHYSGHVYQRNGDPDHDGEALDEFLVPFDNQIISDRELGERLSTIQGWLWTNISGCEAAGFKEGPNVEGPRRLFTASSLEHQKGYERPDWRMSVYTGLLADQGFNKKLGDANKDGYVSIQEAFRWAASQAPPMTAQQRKGVQEPYLAGGDGTEWYLNPPPPPAPPPPAPTNSPTAPQKLCVVKDIPGVPNICL